MKQVNSGVHSLVLSQVRRLSNDKPKYFTVVLMEIGLLLNETEGQLPGLKYNVMKDDLESLILIYQWLGQNWIR